MKIKKIIMVAALVLLNMFAYANNCNYHPSVRAFVRVNLSMQGEKKPGQKIFYSVYDNETKKIVQPNIEVTKDNLVIDLPDMIDPKNSVPSMFEPGYIKARYSVVFYGVEYQKSSVAVKVEIDPDLEQFGVNTEFIKTSGNNGDTYYHLGLFPSYQIIHHPALGVSIPAPYVFSDGQKYAEHKTTCGMGEHCFSCSGNSQPHKIMRQDVDISLRYSLDKYLSTREQNAISSFKATERVEF